MFRRVLLCLFLPLVSILTNEVFAQTADLEITQTFQAPPQVSQDDTITYNLTLVNNGPDLATGIRVNDYLDLKLEFIQAIPSEGTYDAFTGDWDGIDLLSGDTATLTLIAFIIKGGAILNIAFIDSSGAVDPDPTNDFSEFTFSAVKTYLPGACIINMGQTPQTSNNTLKAYGLIHDLVLENQIPVEWAIRPDKSFVNPIAKQDQIDFSVNGVDYRTGAFIIDEWFTPEAIPIINQWTTNYPSLQVNCNQPTFTAPVIEEITSFPKGVLDFDNGDKIEAAFFDEIGVANEIIGYLDSTNFTDPIYNLYRPDGLPNNLNDCDDFYFLPHADPQDDWSALDIETYDAFIKNGRFAWVGCHAVSALETLMDVPSIPGGAPQMNYLSNAGLQPWKNIAGYQGHDDGTPPYNYSVGSFGAFNDEVASDPFMQFIGNIGNALDGGSENIYVPFSAGWRPTTTVAMHQPGHPDVFNGGAYPTHSAAPIVYGRAFGNPDYGMLIYESSHDFSHGNNSENVGAARVFGNFWLQSSIEFRPRIIPTLFPEEMLSSVPTTFAATATGLSLPLTYRWSSDCGGTFSDPTSPITVYTPPNDVTVATRCVMRLVVTDACGRKSFVAKPYTIYPLADLEMTKMAPDTVLAGDTFTYTISVLNTGPYIALFEVSVFDTIPEGLTVVNVNPSVGSWNEPHWLVGELDSAEVAVMTIEVSTNAALDTTTAYVNTAFTTTQSTDLVGGNDTMSVTTFVIVPNLPPVISQPPVVLPEDSFIIFCPSLSDPNLYDELSLNICGSPQNGTASIDTTCVTYTPNAEYNGPDSLCLYVCDNGSPVLCDTVIVPILVTPVNDPPVAVNDIDSTDEDVSVVIDILINDFDTDGNLIPSSVQVITIPSNGTASVDSTNGQITYTPSLNFFGLDTFSYVVCDDGNPLPILCDTARVFLSIRSVDDCDSLVLKVLLEGPYLDNGIMNTILNDYHLLPGQDPSNSANPGAQFLGEAEPVGQPFSMDPFNHYGPEGEMYGDTGVNVIPYAPTVTDWVLLSLRESNTSPSSVVWQCASLLHFDGRIVIPDSCACLALIDSTDYHIVIEHRNHLAVMSPAVQSLNQSLTFDFTSNQSWMFGTGSPNEAAQKQLGAYYLMYGGNSNQVSGRTDINSADNAIWINDFGSIFKYMEGDHTLNADVNSVDRSLWLQNNGYFNLIQF